MKKTGLILALITCTIMLNAVEPSTGEFAHTVFFWLKNPTSKPDCEAFEKSITKFIDNSAYVKTKHLGTPANTNREVIDNSYTYCLKLTFASKEDHDKYQEEKVHKVFIEESSKLWDKVVVYDSVNLW